MRIGIDLTWIKPKKSGGIEVVARHLIEGFTKNEKDIFVLFLANNNYDTFKEYEQFPNFELIKLPINGEKVKKRILYQILFFNHVINQSKIDVFFSPVYAMPILYYSSIPAVVIVHDLQAAHFPEYFTAFQKLWLPYNWKTLQKRAAKIVAISDFVKKDLEQKYSIDPQKIIKINNPVVIKNEFVDFEILKEKYSIDIYNYYYTVLSMLPHKNLTTLIKVIKKIIDEKIEGVKRKLVVSGVDGKNKLTIENEIKKKQLENNIILTGYVEDRFRNALMKYSSIFLFPSTFEGFGIPPVEAMMIGTPVLSTKCTSLYEVTKGKANYIDDPFDINEWIEKIITIDDSKRIPMEFPDYSLETIVNQYLDILHKEGERR